MSKLSSILHTSRLLESLPLSILEQKIIPQGHIREFAKNATVISLQEKVNDISIVLSGKIQMMHLFSNGNYSLITTLTPPESLAIELVGTRTRISPYLAIAAIPSAIFSFPADLILKPGILNPEEQLSVLNQLLTMVSHFNIQKEYRLAILAQNGLRDRIMTYLTMQSAKRQTKTFTIPFSREELASFLCVNRSALSHELSKLAKEGIIEFHKNSFTLLT